MKSIGIPPSNQWFLAFGALTNVYIYNVLQTIIQNIIRGVWFLSHLNKKNGTTRTFVGDSTLQAGSEHFPV